jgi:hypothetical protein
LCPDAQGLVVAGIVQNKVDLPISWMLRAQLMEQFNHGILVDVLFGQNEQMFMSLSAVNT